MTRQMSCGMVVQDHVGKLPRPDKAWCQCSRPPWHHLIRLRAIVRRLEILLAHGASLYFRRFSAKKHRPQDSTTN